MKYFNRKNPVLTENKGKICKIRAAYLSTCGSLMACTLTAFAEGDVLSSVNSLSDMLFDIIGAVGGIVALWGVVQVGMSVQSHDASQRSQGVMTLVGGLIVVFAKVILTSIGAIS